VAHLAASQGVDTWILLSFVADWRWLHPSGQIVGPGGPWSTEITGWSFSKRIMGTGDRRGCPCIECSCG
jgi:hypothetical protein